MKKQIKIAIVAMLFGVVLGNSVPGISAFNNGNGYLLLPAVEKGGYVTGLADGITWAAGVSRDLTWITSCVEGWGNVYIAEVFEEYLQGHPNERHKSSPYIFERAMKAACQ